MPSERSSPLQLSDRLDSQMKKSLMAGDTGRPTEAFEVHLRYPKTTWTSTGAPNANAT